MEFTHFDEQGNAVMVDVGEKPETRRMAKAMGRIKVSREVFQKIQNKEMEKGDVLNVARVAGIMAAKQTYQLIPMCHLLMLTKCSVDFIMHEEEGSYSVEAVCTVKTNGKTGVEMEALTGVSTALLTIYDMCKAVDKSMEMTGIHLVQKTGGKSGDFQWKES